MTHPTHDFKAALEHLERYENPSGVPNEDLIPVPQVETIRFALKLAEKVCGEPSVRVMEEGYQATNDSSRYDIRLSYNAMRSQMLKEIGEGE